MNLHAIAVGVIAAVNPQVPVDLRVSTGPGPTAADGGRSPTFATPGAFVGSVASGVLTVASQSAGKLLRGQTVAGSGLAAQATILAQLTGAPGGIGTYQLSPEQTDDVASEPMTTALTVPAQIQSLTFRDIQQTEGLNLQGERRGIYFYGNVEGLVRVTNKGGDLVTFPDGSVWLVAMVLEPWPDWCKVAATLQNGA